MHLLCGGYANGALARWRTIHELSVIANFLEGKPDTLYQKYLDYSRVETYYEVLEYQKSCEWLGYEPLSQKELAEHDKIITELKTRYGEDFIKPYGWAEGYLDKKKRHFAGIEETVHFNMRSFYKLANNYVHGGSKGLLFEFSASNEDKLMLAGPSNYGLADPGQNTAQSLLFISMMFLNFESYLQRSVHLEIAGKMLGKLSTEFVSVQKRLEAENKELKRMEKGMAYRLSKRAINRVERGRNRTRLRKKRKG